MATPRQPIYTVIQWPTGRVARMDTTFPRSAVDLGVVPDIQSEWPNPRLPVPFRMPGVIRRNGTPAAAESSTLPFTTPILWDNPSRRPYIPELVSGWVSTLGFLGIDTFFGDPGEVPPHEWVNPLRARRPIDLLSWSNSLVGYIPLPPPPGAAMQTLPDRGVRPSHQGFIQGSTNIQPVFVPPTPGHGFWLMRFRRRLDDDEEGIWA